MESGTSYINNGSTVSVVSNGEIIEEFETSGCTYYDLDCCQGCPVCKLENSEEEEEV